MKNTFLLIILISIFLSAFHQILIAGDTTTVQTFTFEDIYKRRGNFVMPPKSESFSKILMLYTLKCDPKTPHDKYNCGEWDYLTYNMIYSKTGTLDSTKNTRMKYSFGYQTPDTLYYANSKKDYIIPYDYYKTTIENVQNEQTFTISSNELQGGVDGKRAHLQFTLTTKSLRDLGMKSGNYQKLQFFTNSVGATLKNLTIKLRSSSSLTSNYFEANGFTTVFVGNYEVKTAGAQDIAFIKPFNWSQFQNINFDISFEQDLANPVIFQVGATSTALYSKTDEIYMDFEEPNDYIDCGNIPELNNASKLSFEAWVNIKKWTNWSAIFNKNDKIFLGTGDKLGQIYCIMRNPDNTYGSAENAIRLNEWNHIAMVFDGTQSTNSEKLKLYINGNPVILTYSGTIPNTSPTNSAPFTISSNFSASSVITASLDEIRVWNNSLSAETILGFKDTEVTTSHPNYKDLLGYYTFNEKPEYVAIDSSPKKHNGRLIGIPKWNYMDNLYLGIQEIPYIPCLTLSRGNYTVKVDTFTVYIVGQKEDISIVKYKVGTNNAVIDTIYYHAPTGWVYDYNSDGSILDSSYVPPTGFYVNEPITYYSLPFEKLDEIEIGRFITPYGINLDLGPQGFTWVYDVTDYEPLLHDTVDFAAGNLQELIDVKFLFIKGVPPRKVNKIHKVWGNMREYTYKNLSDNIALSSTTIDLLPESKSFMLKSRLTGHGHNTSADTLPHCCEWKNNIHYLYSGSNLISTWHIWQTNDCALNPVFPQGGTWPGSREGWCPGDVVKDNDFEVTNYVKNNKLTLDYDISKVPSDNPGMGDGRYVVSMQLFEYGDFSNTIDAEVYDVIMPSSSDYYSRTNPICSDPIVVIRNNGKESLTSLDFEYYVKGGIKSTYNWTGNILSMSTQKFRLPVPTSDFWIGDGSNKFIVNISKPNGKSDQNSKNDSYTSDFNMPDLLQFTTKVQLKTNLRGEHFSYKITDVLGNIVTEKSELAGNTLYEVKFDLPQGCYTLEVIDIYNYGLSYWAFKEQGTGYLKIVDGSGKDIKIFNPDFGHGIKYSFFVGSYSLVQEPNLENLVYLFPNPTENELNLSLNDISGKTLLTIFDTFGNTLLRSEYNVDANSIVKLSTQTLINGSYLIQIENGTRKIVKKFIKK